MTLRKKLIALVVPTVLALIAIPVAVAHAQSAAPARAAAAHAVVHSQAAAATRAAAVHAKSATSAAVKAPVKAAGAAETTDTEAVDDPLGHSDDAAGTTESTVDHQFDGTE